MQNICEYKTEGKFGKLFSGLYEVYPSYIAPVYLLLSSLKPLLKDLKSLNLWAGIMEEMEHQSTEPEVSTHQMHKSTIDLRIHILVNLTIISYCHLRYGCSNNLFIQLLFLQTICILIIYRDFKFIPVFPLYIYTHMSLII